MHDVKKVIPTNTKLVEITASNLRNFRRTAGMNQSDLARQIGVTFQQIGKYERGHNIMSCIRLAQIASVLNRGIQDFYVDVRYSDNGPINSQPAPLAVAS
tara:strand:+ start:232 stop:531 length:300 start_codon:yes stop_codon:yes gene_type:complete